MRNIVSPPPDRKHFPSSYTSPETLRDRSNWYITLRWIAIIFAWLMVLAGYHILHLHLNLLYLNWALGLLLMFNLGYFFLNKKRAATDRIFELGILKLQMVIDVFFLTILMHLTGGVENPFSFLYFIHVVISSIIFKGKEVYQIASLSIALFILEVLGVQYAFLNHYHILSESDHLHDPVYIYMVLGVFCFVILFTAYLASNVTSRYRIIRDELLHKQKQLIAADQAKLDFFRYVAHEMKSPIVTIQTALDTVLSLFKDSLNEKSEDLLTRSRDRSQQVLDTVKDIVDMTQGSEDKPLQFSLCNVPLLIQSIREEMLDEYALKHPTIELRVPDELEIKTYPDLLEKIISNLISNAIRYSEDHCQVIIECIKDKNDLGLIVVDFGIGIDEEDIPRIFDDFFRTPKAKEKEKIGTGLGLAIVKRFVEKLGGSIFVNSIYGEGTTFTVRIPIHES